MASATTRLLLSTAALVSVLAVVSGSGPTWCVPGLAIPHDPLPSCYSYVASRACGVGSVLPLPLAKQRCCRELEDIAAYCRCGALSILMDGVIAPGGQMEGRLPDLPGCPREAQRGVAAALVSPPECNLFTIHGGPYCLSLRAGAGGAEQAVPSE